jgi:hypothetical protein
MSESIESLAFLNAVAGLATRLAVDKLVIYSLTYHSLAFGSWEIEAGRRSIRIRVTWEGKDRHLGVSTAEVKSGSSERRWQMVEDHDFRDRRTDVVQLFGTVHAAIQAHADV